MRWTEWDAFQTYFFEAGQGLKYPKYTDSKLPIKREDFFERVPDDFLRKFNDYQYRFVPVFIRENSHTYYSTDFRLPILKIESLRDVDSAQGVIEKITFEKRYLHYENGASNESVSSRTSQTHVVALTNCFTASSDGIQAHHREDGGWKAQF